MKKRKIVFSTDPSYRDIVEQNIRAIDNQDQELRVWRQRLGGGRIVSIIKGYIGTDEDLIILGKQLKSQCSSGGSVKNGEILIQGDHRDKIVNFLNEKGYKAKTSGG